MGDKKCSQGSFSAAFQWLMNLFGQGLKPF